MKKSMPKLVLKKETIEALDRPEMSQVVGGDPVSRPYFLCKPTD